MANLITNVSLENIRIAPMFTDYEGVQPTLKDKPPADWDHNAMFGRVKIWSGASINNEQIRASGAEMVTSITNSTMSLRTAVQCLRLALSLTSIDDTKTEPIIYQQPRQEEAVEGEVPLAAVSNIPEITTFSAAQFLTRTPRRPLTMAAPAAGIDIGQGEAGAPVPVEDAYIVGPPAQVAPGSNRRQANAYTFLAAYLMKLLVKDPGTVVAGLGAMKTKFEVFFGPSSIISEFNLNLTQSQTMKDALTKMSIVGMTYTHALAYTHNEMMEDMSEEDKGVLSYLAFIHFSYTGLHAMNLMIQLQVISKASLAALLSLFYVDVTAGALLKMAQIFVDYERTTEHPDRSLTHRYCTHWGQEYFGQLRTKNCPHLAYTIAVALTVLQTTSDRADPTRIVGVSSLSESMRDLLRRAGTIIGNTLQDKMLGGNNSSQAFQIAVTQRREEEEEEEAEEQEIYENIDI